MEQSTPQPVVNANQDWHRKPNERVINQRLAGNNVFTALQSIAERTHNEKVIKFIEGGAPGVARRICPLAASASCMNELFGQKVIDLEGSMSAGTLIGIAAKFQDEPDLTDDQGISFPRWEAITGEQLIRYQALVTIAKGLGLEAEVIENCNIPTLVDLLTNGGNAAISVKNEFITHHTDKKATHLVAAGHIIALLGIKKGETDDPYDYIVDVADPYADPTDPPVAEIPLSVIIQYLGKDAFGDPICKGMAFAIQADTMQPIREFKAKGALYPMSVVEAVQKVTGEVAVVRNTVLNTP